MSIEFTNKEQRVFDCLRVGTVVSKVEICNACEISQASNVLEVLVMRLRKKLASKRCMRDIGTNIKAVRNKGYLLVSNA